MKSNQPTLPEPQSLESLLQRDLAAWLEAKAAIERAKGK
jgi:hypothetical protein